MRDLAPAGMAATLGLLVLGFVRRRVAWRDGGQGMQEPWGPAPAGASAPRVVAPPEVQAPPGDVATADGHGTATGEAAATPTGEQVAANGHGAGPEDLMSLTRQELYERAKACDLPGRSTMSKRELAEALAAAGER